MVCRKIVDVCRRPLAIALRFRSSATAHTSASTVETRQFQQLVTSRWLFHPADHPQSRHHQPCSNRSLSYLKDNSTISSPQKLEGSDEDPVTNDGSVFTPSLKREITTKDIFLAKRKETEERLSQSGVTVNRRLVE